MANESSSHDHAHADVSVPAHSHEEEVAHAWHHFHENWKFFACFFAIIVLTVATWSINFGPVGNDFFMYFTAALRSGLIAYFMLSLFKPFSLIRSTFIFSAIFLAGMIFLSWWDSELRGMGNPVYNHADPQMMHEP